MAENRLFLLDGMALVYRAHFALIRSPIYTSGGVNTSALYGFTNTLVDLLQNQSPTHLAVAFDTSAPTPRHEMFPDYKAQREAMPEDLAVAIPAVKRLVKAFRIPVLEHDGYEADDLIGTLALKAEQAGGFRTFMVTPDKDFAQLVSDRTVIYKPGYRGGEHEILDLPAVLAQWEIERPGQVIDVLGLMGDASDNIPGIPGFGEKTAKKLVSQFGGVEEVIAHAGELKGKQRERVEQFGEQAILSKKLATIMRDAPVDVTFDELKVEPPDEAAVKSLFVEFEFNSLGKRLFGDEFKAGRGHASRAIPTGRGEGEGDDNGGAGEPVQGELLMPELKTLKDVPHDYRHVHDAESVGALVRELSGAERFCFDLETSSLDVREAKIIGIAFSCAAGSGSYVDCTRPGLLEAVRPLLEAEGIEKIGHNLKFDLSVLLWNGIRAVGPFFDTMLVHSIVEPDQRHGMDYLAERYLGYSPIPIENLIGSRKSAEGQLSMAELAGDRIDEIVDYAVEDADVTWQLAGILRPKLAESGQEAVYSRIEAPLLPVLVAMEHAGIRLDSGALREISRELESEIAGLETEIVKLAGTRFNLNSPKQLGQILFEILKLADKPKKTKTGQYRTDEQTLTGLAGVHPIVQRILDYREATKLKSTYVDALPDAVFPRTGRIHTTFHQLMTATGRLASNNPNLQNIPIRSAKGREIRKAFVPGEPGWRLLSADYSQIELRVMASISGDPAMIEAFEQGLDIHSATAARVYGVRLREVVPEMRRTAKMVNFGIIYGISSFGLSQRLGIPRSEAASIIEAYFTQYPGVQAFMEGIVESARKNGFVETLSGRRRYLRDINSANGNIRSAAERTAINTPIQGTAADMIKLAMAAIDAALRDAGLASRMLLQVHDELVFEVPDGEEDATVAIVEDGMKSALALKVPIVVETGLGANWLEAH